MEDEVSEENFVYVVGLPSDKNPVYQGAFNFTPYLVKEINTENNIIKLHDIIYGSEKEYDISKGTERLFTREEDAISFVKELYPVEDQFRDYFRDIMANGDRINEEHRNAQDRGIILRHPVFKRYPNMSFVQMDATEYICTGKEPSYKDCVVYMKDEDSPQLLGFVRIEKGDERILMLSEKPIRSKYIPKKLTKHLSPEERIKRLTVLKKESINSAVGFIAKFFKKEIIAEPENERRGDVVLNPSKEMIQSILREPLSEESDFGQELSNKIR